MREHPDEGFEERTQDARTAAAEMSTGRLLGAAAQGDAEAKAELDRRGIEPPTLEPDSDPVVTPEESQEGWTPSEIEAGHRLPMSVLQANGEVRSLDLSREEPPQAWWLREYASAMKIEVAHLEGYAASLVERSALAGKVEPSALGATISAAIMLSASVDALLKLADALEAEPAPLRPVG